MEEEVTPPVESEYEQTSSVSKRSSQATINLDPKTNVKSDFAMKEEHESVIPMNEKSDSPSTDSKTVSRVSFVEGLEATLGLFPEEVAYEELEGEYEAAEPLLDDWELREMHREAFKRRRSRRKSIRADFAMRSGSGLFGAITKLHSFGSLSDEEDEESGEGEGEEGEKGEGEAGEEEEVIADREPYYELYRSLLAEYPMVRMKNNFLQRKMAEYFKKRKMEHVLREGDRIGDAEEKYFAKLDALCELKTVNDMQRNALTAELDEMKDLRNKQYASVISNFEGMLAREKEIGTGLIFTKTAKEIPEKFLERLIKNQRLKSNEITDMRLRYIKLRNSIDEVTTAIKAMDKIGDNYTLMDYEQLKMENQNYSDKIEERDDELSRLREKCSGAIQTLAHLREKSAAMDLDILEKAERLEDAVCEKNEFRERVVQLKHERDTLRANIVRLQEESGLLTKRKLLLDMEDTLDQIANIKMEVERIEKTYQDNAKALEIIKHNIKVEREAYQNRAFKVSDVGKKPKIKKGYKPKNPNLKIGASLEKFDVTL